MVQYEVKCMYLAVPRERIMFSACACFAFVFVVSVNMHTRVLCTQTNCLGCASRSLFIQLYSHHSTCVYDYQLMLHIILCVIIHIPSQWWNVQHWHQFQTELFHMPRIWILIIMWIQWLLIPVMMVTVCLDLTLECVYSEGCGLA